MALIEYIKVNKQEDNDWFKIQSNKEGTKYHCFTEVVWKLLDHIRVRQV
jgi:hypothetical protein